MRGWALGLVVTSLVTAGALCAEEKLERRPLDEQRFGKLLKAHEGSVVAFSFWATWCEPCKEEFPDILRLRTEFEEAPFYLAIVSVDDPDDWEDKVLPFLQDQKVDFPVYLKAAEDDESFINTVDPDWYGGLPAFFIFGPDGKLRKSFYEREEFATLRDAVREHLKEISQGER